MKKMIFFISSFFEKVHLPGVWIGNRYKVVRHLGSGSYGHTYLVFDQSMGIQCVLKTLRWHRRMIKSGRTEFNHEIEILKNIRHAGFPTYLESGKARKTPYYAMEFIDGYTFEQLIFQEGKTYQEVECFILAEKLLETIDYLHQHQIIHRDIRIPNIMLEGERLRIIDVGLARQMESDRITLKKHPRKQCTIQSDYYGLGHFLLFLLYSTYTPRNEGKERSWEEELTISNVAKTTIRRLLQIDKPYQNVDEIHQDFQKIIKKQEVEGMKTNGFF